MIGWIVWMLTFVLIGESFTCNRVLIGWMSYLCYDRRNEHIDETEYDCGAVNMHKITLSFLDKTIQMLWL